MSSSYDGVEEKQTLREPSSTATVSHTTKKIRSHVRRLTTATSAIKEPSVRNRHVGEPLNAIPNPNNKLTSFVHISMKH
jgi:hypothetical protein